VSACRQLDQLQSCRVSPRKRSFGSQSRQAVERYQLDLITPGIWPRTANSRKQIRHSPNRRMYPRGRPHMRQRLRTRVGYLRPSSLAIIDFLANAMLLCFSSPSPSTVQRGPTHHYDATPLLLRGIPRSCSRCRASSSLSAVVTIDISIPRTWSIES
jgi:hypothetical protein